MTDTPLINMPHTNTIEDALAACDSTFASLTTDGRCSDDHARRLGIIRDVLTRLVAKAEPEGRIESDEQGYIIEGAYQSGFDSIDDNGDLLVVHANDLIRYVTTQRIPHWISNKRRPLSLDQSGLVVKAWDAPAFYPPSFWAGRADSKGIKTLSCDWYIRIPELPTLEERTAMGIL
jgi:hypothetical protein